MRFLDKENIGLKFYKKRTKQTLFFKAYLDKNDVQYKIEETVLPSLAVGTGYSHLKTRIFNEMSIEFNVYSENLEEAAENYEKLHLLISFIKPKILRQETGYEYSLLLNDPRTDLFFSFKGMPRILNSRILNKNSDGSYDVKSNPELDIDDIPIQIYNFSYSINKDMGYIQMPPSYKERAVGKLFSEKGTALVPISYKISFVARVSADIEFFNDIEYNEAYGIRGSPLEEKFVLPAYRNIYKQKLKGVIVPFVNSPVSSVSSNVKGVVARPRTGTPTSPPPAAAASLASPPTKSATIMAEGFSYLTTSDKTKERPEAVLKAIEKYLRSFGIINLDSVVAKNIESRANFTEFDKSLGKLAAVLYKLDQLEVSSIEGVRTKDAKLAATLQTEYNYAYSFFQQTAAASGNFPAATSP
jgi:hypothetical protein